MSTSINFATIKTEYYNRGDAVVWRQNQFSRWNNYVARGNDVTIRDWRHRSFAVLYSSLESCLFPLSFIWIYRIAMYVIIAAVLLCTALGSPVPGIYIDIVLL